MTPTHEIKFMPAELSELLFVSTLARQQANEGATIAIPWYDHHMDDGYAADYKKALAGAIRKLRRAGAESDENVQ